MGNKKNDYEILMTAEGGFFFGRMLKNGTMSADSVRIDEDQMTNAFAAWFERHCQREGTDMLWIGNPDGAILVKQYTNEELQAAATEANLRVAAQQQAGKLARKPKK